MLFQWKRDIKIVSLGSCGGMLPPSTRKNKFCLLGQDGDGRATLPKPEDLKVAKDAENAMQTLFLPEGRSLPEAGGSVGPWLPLESPRKLGTSSPSSERLHWCCS